MTNLNNEAESAKKPKITFGKILYTTAVRHQGFKGTEEEFMKQLFKLPAKSKTKPVKGD